MLTPCRTTTRPSAPVIQRPAWSSGSAGAACAAGARARNRATGSRRRIASEPYRGGPNWVAAAHDRPSTARDRQRRGRRRVRRGGRVGPVDGDRRRRRRRATARRGTEPAGGTFPRSPWAAMAVVALLLVGGIFFQLALLRDQLSLARNQ